MGHSILPKDPSIAGVVIKESNVCDCVPLAIHMRELDKQEVLHSSGLTPFKALSASLLASNKAFTAFKDGIPFQMFGVVDTDIPDWGVIWLLGTDVIETMPMMWIRQSKLWIDYLCQDYTAVFNHISEENKLHLKWIQFLGGELVQRVEDYGPHKKPFITFVRYSNV